MRIVALAGLVTLVLFTWGCVECECTCRCTEAGTENEDTFIVDEEADCDGECEQYTTDTCPNFTHESFSVDCS